MSRRAVLAVVAFLMIADARGALAQPAEGLPPAGVIPSNIAIAVTGTPAADGGFLEGQIRAALDRQIRPTLRPGAGINVGAFAPWPLLPLATGARSAVNVAISIAGDAQSSAVSGVTTVTVDNLPLQPFAPAALFLSDDPEYLQSDGLVFHGTVAADRAARLYYYHSDIGAPRDLDVVVTAAVPTRVQFVTSGAGPELDVMNVGHLVTRDFLRYQQQNEGAVVDIAPGTPYAVRHALLLQGEVVAGAVDVNVLRGGPVAVSVIAAPAGSRPEAYLEAPRVPYDGHSRHGTFDLREYGPISASFTAGGGDAAVTYGSRTRTPRNLNPNDTGHDYGDYGVVQRITFTLANPTDVPHVVHLYQKPLGGPVRSTFVVDGFLKELGCVRLPQAYWLTSYQLPPHSSGASTTVTMTDGGSFYPLEFGVTETLPQTYTPPPGAPEGCSAVRVSGF